MVLRVRRLEAGVDGPLSRHCTVWSAAWPLRVTVWAAGLRVLWGSGDVAQVIGQSHRVQASHVSAGAFFQLLKITHLLQESLRRNGVAITVNKRGWNAVLECSLKNDRMVSVHFQGKPFNITVIQVYGPTSNAEEAEVEQFSEDLQDLLELITKKVSFSL